MKIPIGGITPQYFRGNIPLREKDGRWVPARPIPYRSRWNQLRHAWNVLIYKADALYWDD